MIQTDFLHQRLENHPMVHRNMRNGHQLTLIVALVVSLGAHEPTLLTLVDVTVRPQMKYGNEVTPKQAVKTGFCSCSVHNVNLTVAS